MFQVSLFVDCQKMSRFYTLLLASMATLTVLSRDTSVSAFPGNRDLIPNGHRVPDPCRPGRTAQGVGHLSADGGGPRNAFGNDFASARSWTSALCNMDSDGDGLTNGAELGDSSCTWSVGQTPSSTTGITHPGIDNDNTNCLIPPWLWAIFFWWTVIFEPPQ